MSQKFFDNKLSSLCSKYLNKIKTSQTKLNFAFGGLKLHNSIICLSMGVYSSCQRSSGAWKVVSPLVGSRGTTLVEYTGETLETITF